MTMDSEGRADAAVEDGVWLIEARGEFDADSTAEIGMLIDEGVHRGVQAVALELSRVTFADSALLHLLLQKAAVYRPTPLPVVLVSPSTEVLRLLELTQTTVAFHISPTLGHARGQDFSPNKGYGR